MIRAYASAGVRHIVALRGDPPGGLDTPYVAPPDGYQSTSDLVSAIKAIGDFEVSVSPIPISIRRARRCYTTSKR